MRFRRRSQQLLSSNRCREARTISRNNICQQASCAWMVAPARASLLTVPHSSREQVRGTLPAHAPSALTAPQIHQAHHDHCAHCTPTRCRALLALSPKSALAPAQSYSSTTTIALAHGRAHLTQPAAPDQQTPKASHPSAPAAQSSLQVRARRSAELRKQIQSELARHRNLRRSSPALTPSQVSASASLRALRVTLALCSPTWPALLLLHAATRSRQRAFATAAPW